MFLALTVHIYLDDIRSIIFRHPDFTRLFLSMQFMSNNTIVHGFWFWTYWHAPAKTAPTSWQRICQFSSETSTTVKHIKKAAQYSISNSGETCCNDVCVSAERWRKWCGRREERNVRRAWLFMDSPMRTCRVGLQEITCVSMHAL